jgi:hypothetical protein
LHFNTILLVLSNSTPALPLFLHRDSGILYVSITKTHQQPPLTMANISSLSSRTTMLPSYCIMKSAQETNISNGDDYAWQYFVSLST